MTSTVNPSREKKEHLHHGSLYIKRLMILNHPLFTASCFLKYGSLYVLIKWLRFIISSWFWSLVRLHLCVNVDLFIPSQSELFLLLSIIKCSCWSGEGVLLTVFKWYNNCSQTINSLWNSTRFCIRRRIRPKICNQKKQTYLLYIYTTSSTYSSRIE